MAELIGAGASVITLLEAVRVAVVYVNCVRDASKEVENLFAVFREFRNELEDYNALICRTIDESHPESLSKLPALKRLIEPKDRASTISHCVEQIKSLNERLQRAHKTDNSRASKAFHSFVWPFEKKEMLKVLDQIKDVKGKLHTALERDNTRLNLDTHNNVETLLKKTSTTQNVVLQESVFKWLSAPDPSINHSEAMSKQKNAKCRWFLECERYSNWKSEPHSSMWIHGRPGCGKTMLSSYIIDDLETSCQQDPEKAIAYFYFKFNDGAKQSGGAMMLSLVKQLSQKSAVAMRKLEELYTSHHNGEKRLTSDRLLLLLRDLCTLYPTIYIVLDALEESEPWTELEMFIRQIRSWDLKQIHFLCVSRREADIPQTLDELVPRKYIIEMHSKAVTNDIRAYIDSRISGDSKLKRWSSKPEVLQEVEEHLLSKADGMFRWVECQLDALRHCLTPRSMREALKNLPPTLPDTYKRILDRLDSSYRSKVIKALFWVAFSTRPLTAEELAETMAINADEPLLFDLEDRLLDPAEAIRICSSLVTTIERDSKTWVFLAHFTVKEYLMTISTLTESTTVESYGNTMIAEDCISYLTATRVGNHEPLGHTTDLAYPRISTQNPLVQYASNFWTYHTHKAGEHHERLFSIMVKFFCSHALKAYLHISEKAYSYEAAYFHGFPDNLWCFHSMKPNPLGQAVERGFFRLAQHLLQEGADVKSIESSGYSAFSFAAKNGHAKVLKMLLDADASTECSPSASEPVTPSTYPKEYALNRAAAKGHADVVSILLDYGAAPNQKSKRWARYRYPLIKACIHGHIPVARVLLSKGASVNAGADENINTALHAACCATAKMSSDVAEALLELLLSHGADLEAGKNGHGTPLATASYWGNLTAMKSLIDAGADIDAQDEGFGSVLHAACQSIAGDAAASLLLDVGADAKVHATTGTTLQAACNSQRMSGLLSSSLIKRLVDGGVDVNGSGSRWCSALQGAASQGCLSSVRLLLEKGAQVNAQKNGHGNALQAAAMKGSIPIIQLLLDHGADVNAIGDHYDSALHAAASWGHVAAVKLLLDHGADVSARMDRDSSVMQGAAIHGSTEIIQLLWKAGADVNAGGGLWGSPLHTAAERGNDACVQLLLEYKAEVNIKGGQFTTPLRAALVSGNGKAGTIARRLLAAGAAPEVHSRSESRLQLAKDGADDLEIE
ncbi:MAG: hypothetical protein Q9174_003850 [Haloplaca sp. 1 TL-2023]